MLVCMRVPSQNLSKAMEPSQHIGKTPLTGAIQMMSSPVGTPSVVSGGVSRPELSPGIHQRTLQARGMSLWGHIPASLK